MSLSEGIEYVEYVVVLLLEVLCMCIKQIMQDLGSLEGFNSIVQLRRFLVALIQLSALVLLYLKIKVRAAVSGTDQPQFSR